MWKLWGGTFQTEKSVQVKTQSSEIPRAATQPASRGDQEPLNAMPPLLALSTQAGCWTALPRSTPFPCPGPCLVLASHLPWEMDLLPLPSPFQVWLVLPKGLLTWNFNTHLNLRLGPTATPHPLTRPHLLRVLLSHKPLCLVAQSCPTLCDPSDYPPPGSSVHVISRQEYWSELPFPSPTSHLGLHNLSRVLLCSSLE